MQTLSQTPANWIARTGSHIDRIRINSLRKEKIAGEPMWIKRRTAASRWLVPVANTFFWLAGNPVRVFPAGSRWQKYEIELFHLLNGPTLQAGSVGNDTVYFEPLAGIDLVELLQAGRFSSEVAALVGQAFYEMHQNINPFTGERFSHGDPHLGNVIYHSADQRIGWVDFETRHLPHLTNEERQADDLLIFLLDLAGRVDWPRWTELSARFLAGYADPPVIAQLEKRLVAPRGVAAIWWAVRTSYLSRKELRQRLAWLRARL